MRKLKGFIMLAIFIAVCLSETLQNIVFLSPEIMSTWWGWILQLVLLYFLMRCLFVGVYSFTAGSNFVPGWDDGDYSFRGAIYDFFFNNQGIVSGNKVRRKRAGEHGPNASIHRVLEYRNAKIAMMDNQSALNEVAATAGMEVMLNSDSRAAQLLDSQLAMKDNESALRYCKGLFGSNK